MSAQYRLHYDAIARVEQKFVIIQWLLVDEPPLTGKANIAEKMTRASYNKLKSRMTMLFWNVIVQLHIVMIDGDEVQNTVPIQRGTETPRLREHFLTSAHTPGSSKNNTHIFQ